MVKRKAAISLDEWLIQSARLEATTTTDSAKNPADQSCNPAPALVETSPESEPHPSAAAELVVSPTTGEGEQAQATVAEGEAHEWFWRLLEQAGFERW